MARVNILDDILIDVLPKNNEIKRGVGDAKRSMLQKGKPQTAEHIENAAKTRRGVPKTKEHNQKNSDAQRGKKHSDSTIKKRIASIMKPIHTPYGDFDSRKSAIEWMTNNNIKGAEGRIRKGFIDDPDNFYYIKEDGND
jgi:hypothetical protein